MKYKTLIDNIKIPALGLGTWLIGGGTEADYSDDQNAIKSIKKAIGLGYTHIDTAEMYGSGHSEELIGEAIKDFDRNKLFITTKVGKTKLRYDNVIKSAKESIKRLKTNYIDLFLVHSPSSEIPIEETMKAFDFLVEQKLIKYIGVSNFQVEQLTKAQKYTKNKIVANQIEYSLLTRNKGEYADNKDMESKTIPYCQENNIIIMAERPIERGSILKTHPLLDKLELKYHKTKAQIAMNWLISKKNIIVIPKSVDENHLKENLGSIGWKLEKEDVILLDKIKFN
ncbi:MAG: aldo/keto reductase [Candidatus Gracilibacteria bacterium]